MDRDNGVHASRALIVSPAELEFLAEDETVFIIPNIRTEELRFISVCHVFVLMIV
jgi:hypothetical protein